MSVFSAPPMPLLFFSMGITPHNQDQCDSVHSRLYEHEEHSLVKYKRCSTSKSTLFLLELSRRFGMGQGTDLGLPKIVHNNYLQNQPSKLLQTVLQASEVMQ